MRSTTLRRLLTPTVAAVATVAALAPAAHAETRFKSVSDPTGDVETVSNASTTTPKDSVDATLVTYSVDTVAKRLYVKYRLADVRSATDGGGQSYATQGTLSDGNGANKVKVALIGYSKTPGTVRVVLGGKAVSCDDASQSINAAEDYVTQSVPLSCLNKTRGKFKSATAATTASGAPVHMDVTKQSKNLVLIPPPPPEG